jgi:hypothetical protein
VTYATISCKSIEGFPFVRIQQYHIFIAQCQMFEEEEKFVFTRKKIEVELRSLKSVKRNKFQIAVDSVWITETRNTKFQSYQ